MPIYVDVISKLDEKAAKSAADQIEKIYAEAGKRAGSAFDRGVSGGLSGSGSAADIIGRQMQQAMQRHGREAGRGFGSSFGSELSRSIPGVSGLSSMLSGYEGTASKAGALAGKALGTAFTTAAAGVIGLAATSLFKGFERYKSLDATAHRLGAMGKSGEQVRDIMGQINDVVTGTPVALDAAAASATKFLQSGVKEGKPLKTVLTAIADAAGASGASFEDMSLIFGQVLNKGKLQAEEMLQMAERNLPIQQALQKEFGLTGAQIEKMSKDGTLSFGMLVQAVEGQFGGMSQKLGDTVDGAMSKMNSAISRTGANFIAALFGDPMSTTEGPGAMAEAINKITAKFEMLNQWVIAHKDDIKRFFDDAVEAAKSLGGMLRGLLDFFDKIGIGVTDVVTAFVAWKSISGVIALTNQLNSIGTVLSKNLPAQASVGAAGISRELSKIAIPAWLASFLSGKMEEALGTEDTENRRTIPRWVPILPFWEDVAREALDKPYFPERLNPGAAGPPPGVTGTPDALNPGFFLGDGPDTQIFNPGTLGGPRGAQAERRGGSSGAGASPADEDYGSIADMFPGAAGGDDEAGGGKKEGLPKAPALPFDTTLPPEIAQIFAGRPMTSSILAEQESWLKKRHDLQEKEARLQQLLASNVATEDDIQKARNDALEAERDLQRETLKLHESAAKDLEKAGKQVKGVSDSLGEIGASLDRDFGISKGLAGIAENITKFVANLAFAPAAGALSAVSQAGGGQAAGSGLAGVIGGAMGFGPAFEQQATSLAASAMGPALLGGAMGGPVAEMMALAQRSSGGKYGWGASNLAAGLADCSGAVSDLVEVLQQGGATPGRLFNTESFPQYAAQHGWQKGYMPGALNVGVRHGGPGGGHMAATLPNGVNFESGGSHGGIAYGGPAAGALDPQFTEQWYLPLGGAPAQQPATTPSSGGAGNPWFSPGFLPPGITGGGGESPVFSGAGTQPSLGIGGGAGIGGLGPTPGGIGGSAGSGVQIGGAAPSWGSGKGGVGIQQGGLVDTAIQMGLSAGGLAIDAMAPGAGQVAAAAANMGIKLGNRAIQFAGQAAGIGVGGLLETFLPFGGSELAQNNWLTRIVGGIAGAAPQIPNIAGPKDGEKKGPQPPVVVDPNTKTHGSSGGQAPGPVFNTTINTPHSDGGGIGRDFQFEIANSHAAPGMGMGGR